MMRFLAAFGLLATVSTAHAGQKIAWFGTWEAAKKAAARTKQPILFVSAAPHCRNISGIW